MFGRKAETRTGRADLSVRAVVLVACALATFLLTSLACQSVALAADDKPYQEGKVQGDDFEGAVPKKLPVEDGVTIKAKTEAYVGYEYGADVTKKGDKYTYTPNNVETEAGMDKKKSWNSDKKDADLLDHEQGHVDLAEIARRRAQAEINEKTKKGELKGVGSTEAEAKADLEAKLDEIITRNRDNLDKEYDDTTKHNTKAKEQAEERKKQQDLLNPPKDKKDGTKKGPEAKSRSKKSIAFDAATGLLTIDNDFIIEVVPTGPGFVPDPNDPVLGSELVFPEFSLGNKTADGHVFFIANGADPKLIIDDGGTVLMSADLNYMVYNPDENRFFGLAGYFDEAAPGTSVYIDGLVDALINSPNLWGVELDPDADFYAATSDFTASASSAFSNGTGARDVGPFPAEPGALVLLALGGLCLRNKRRR